MVLKWGQFCPQGDIGNVWKYVWLSQMVGDPTGTQWVEAREPAKHNTMHKTAHKRKNDLVLDVNSAKTE